MCNDSGVTYIRVGVTKDFKKVHQCEKEWEASVVDQFADCCYTQENAGEHCRYDRADYSDDR